jgi:hypothetical protein
LSAAHNVSQSATAQDVGRSAAAQNVGRSATAQINDRSEAEDPGRIANARKEDPAHGPLDADRADRLEATLGA